MGIIGSIFSGNSARTAATRAANVQVQGAQQAQALEKQNQTNALDFQNNEWTGQQANEQPFLQLGQQSANSLADYLKTPFQAPTLDQARNSPGYQFELQTGANAIDENAAATGNLMSGNTGTALEKFGTALADSTYNDIYGRALNTYMTNYNTLLGGTQVGQTATGQLGQEGQAAAQNTGAIDLTGGAEQAQQINNAAAARASGYIGKSNATGQTVNNIDQQLMEAALLAGG